MRKDVLTMSKATAAKPEVKSWGDFTTPFYQTTYPGAEKLNQQLQSVILQQEAEGPSDNNRHANRYVTSNQVNIFESHFDLFKDPNAPACILELKKFFLFGIFQAMAETSGYGKEELEQIRVFTDAWYHVTRNGGFISSHNHPNASRSAVYMVNPGSLTDDPRNGVLSFKDPRPTANMYLDPGNESWQRHFHMASVNHPMQPGELLVFPSFLMHEVMPYFGELPRITVAANCSFKRV
jgi:uncharacterized protein (TIGR02466 family)